MGNHGLGQKETSKETLDNFLSDLYVQTSLGSTTVERQKHELTERSVSFESLLLSLSDVGLNEGLNITEPYTWQVPTEHEFPKSAIPGCCCPANRAAALGTSQPSLSWLSHCKMTSQYEMLPSAHFQASCLLKFWIKGRMCAWFGLPSRHGRSWTRGCSLSQGIKTHGWSLDQALKTRRPQQSCSLSMRVQGRQVERNGFFSMQNGPGPVMSVFQWGPLSLCAEITESPLVDVTSSPTMQNYQSSMYEERK